MKERASGSHRLPASAWLFDSRLALVAAVVSTLVFAELLGDARPALPHGTLALGYALVLLHTLPLAARPRFRGAGQGPPSVGRFIQLQSAVVRRGLVRRQRQKRPA